jgi:XTP/dITP diphosphohydrolase
MPIEIFAKIILATRNLDKAREIRAIFKGFPIPIEGLDAYPSVQEVEETGKTLEENAILKAMAARDSTGRASLADDSGLFVEALNGEPGVFSARFAGEGATYSDNNARLLELLRGIPREERGASFVCVVALVLENGKCEIFRGEITGYITTEPRGDRGFGYDPVFFHPPSGRTFAELSPEEKNLISHRYLAFSNARKYMEKTFVL